MHWHGEHGPLPSVPVVTLPPAAEPKDRWLTRREAAALLRAALHVHQTVHVARLILIGLYTGTRPGAILQLRWMPSTAGGWIDLDAGVLHRRSSTARLSRKRHPPVRIPDQLAAHLRRWRATDLSAEPKRLHVVHYHGAPISKLRRSWATAAQAAGLGRDVTPHTLRHTATTWLMQAGVDIGIAAGFLGMTVDTLESVYGHHHPAFQAGVANARRGRNRPAAEPPARRGTDPQPATETPQKPSENSRNSGQATSSNVLKLRKKP